MADVWIMLTVLAFFGLCVALVWVCDKIIGPDDGESVDEPADVVQSAASR